MLQAIHVEGVLYRSARAADVESLVALLFDLFTLETDFVPDSKRQYAGIMHMIDHPERAFIAVAESRGGVVGMCSIQSVFSTAEGGLAGLIEDCVVAPAFRGKGIGKRLLAVIAQWAMSNGAYRLQLLADEYNEKALHFYTRNGWIETRLRCYRQLLERPGTTEV